MEEADPAEVTEPSEPESEVAAKPSTIYTACAAASASDDAEPEPEETQDEPVEDDYSDIEALFEPSSVASASAAASASSSSVAAAWLDELPAHRGLAAEKDVG